MKCPRCGNEMTVDSHRRYPVAMCYECGYIEGQNVEPIKAGKTNYERLKALNFNETTAFISAGLGVDHETVENWLNKIE